MIIWIDPNFEAKAPGWLYVIAGVMTFVYQTFDGIDGKQA